MLPSCCGSISKVMEVVSSCFVHRLSVPALQWFGMYDIGESEIREQFWTALKESIDRDDPALLYLDRAEESEIKKAGGEVPTHYLLVIGYEERQVRRHKSFVLTVIDPMEPEGDEHEAELLVQQELKKPSEVVLYVMWKIIQKFQFSFKIFLGESQARRKGQVPKLLVLPFRSKIGRNVRSAFFVLQPLSLFHQGETIQMRG